MIVPSSDIESQEQWVTEEDEIVVDGELDITCSICNVDDGIIICAGTEQHLFCSECLQGYARANFDLSGEYQRSRACKYNEIDLTSDPGQLPCPLFINGECDCTCLDPSMLRRLVDDDVFDLWRQADVRIGISVHEKDMKESQKLIEAFVEQRTPLETLRLVFQETLTRGSTVSCPECSTNGEKDDMCMHIHCTSCHVNWCYCCGRRRCAEFCTKENGCDSTSPYIESQPGWENYAVGDETPGQGALHEFHRRRIQYLLKRLKDCTDLELWNELQDRFPHLLDDVPTTGRSIDWDTIDEATIPTFGNTNPVDVAWNVEGNNLFEALGAQMEEAIRNERANQMMHKPLAVVQTNFARCLVRNDSKSKWIKVCICYVIFSALLSASITVPKEFHQDWCLAGLCIYIIGLLTIIVAEFIDWRYKILLENAPEVTIPYAEVQFLGSHEEYPYLSSMGRWSKCRYIYLTVLFSLIVAGIALINQRQYYRIGLTVLIETAMVFGGGTILINLSPPPKTTSYRNRINTFQWNVYCLLVYCCGMLPFGIYLSIPGDESHEHWQKVLGALLVCVGSSVVLADLSDRFFNHYGFSLDVGSFTIWKSSIFFWLMTVAGLGILRRGSRFPTILILGCCLSFGPSLLFLLHKIRQSFR